MEIKFNNRLVIINGPSCSGKTTLADRIQAEYKGKCVVICHDDILGFVDKNQPQEKIDEDFHHYFLAVICGALEEESIDLVVLDTLNVGIKQLLTFITVIKGFSNYQDLITLIKMNIDTKLHDEFIAKRTSDSFVKRGVKSQVEYYKGIEGSLNKSIPFCDTFVVKNPKDVTLKFDLSKKLKRK